MKVISSAGSSKSKDWNNLQQVAQNLKIGITFSR
jgi:hypothetical protein